ncbi:streptophobe family protein [Streptomyces sp. NPDC051098]|uniref:streptophobe family protein n=1 Tax=Streptomyces sp. NPDC051098 TaxID=3155411 RepID=UPI00343A1395
MSATGSDAKVPWVDVALSSIAAVSWALMGMAGAAALGLHLLGADASASPGPMTAAVVVLAVNGSVTPSGDVSAFGLDGATAETAVDFTPLGVGLCGALPLAYVFLRSLRRAGPHIPGGELAARAGGVVVLFVATVGGLAWAGHDVITIDGAELGLSGAIPGTGGDDGIEAPGLGDIGDIGGLLPDRIGDLVDADAAVGFSVNTADSLLGALLWVSGVLVVALLAGRRAPLPRGALWEAVRHHVRPAASAMVAVMLVAVLAGYAAAAYAAVGDDHPRRIAGAALLGAPNGAWLGVPLGLFVPWDGRATGELARVLPDPLDEFLRISAAEPATVSRLAELDGRVWLLTAATAVMMLYAGVLAASRTPVDRRGAAGFAGRCAVRLASVGALTLPLLVWLTDVSADASLSVLGFDAFGAGIELHGRADMALVLGAAWGAVAGGAGALLVYVTRGGPRDEDAFPVGVSERPGPYRPASPHRPPNPDTNPYLRLPPEVRDAPAEGGAAQDRTGRDGTVRDRTVRDRTARGGAAWGGAAWGRGAASREGDVPLPGRGTSVQRDRGAPADRDRGGPPEIHGAPTVAGSMPPPPHRRPPPEREDGPPPPGPPKSGR